MKRLVLLMAAALSASLVCPAGAATSRDGVGLFVADDDWDFASPGALPALDSDFERLRPKVFRLQTIWNTVDRPEWLVRADAMIAEARSRGVRQIVLTLRSNNPANVGPEGYFPTPDQYRAKVEPLVQRLAGQVDVWGPANEPNIAWRPKEAPGGQAPLEPTLLAGYYGALHDAVREHDPSASITSPDFLDAGSLAAFLEYVTTYSAAAGGGWGDVVALHPYGDVERAVAPTAPAIFTDALAALAPPGKDLWVTEVGAHYEGNPAAQAARVAWIADVLASHPRVKRVAYYNMRGGGSEWDTGLLDGAFVRRPAWYVWCAAVHGDDPANPDCAAPPPGAGGPGCIAYFVEYLLLDTREWPGVRCV
ncbi:MAG TPA: glycosyl hydrolase [Solirubrobacteraceae bacterium]|nr:glycosyl hydrolase [Solirubrobacteraceae bacterium]